MPQELHYHIQKPAPSLADFVDSFWMLHNASGNDKKLVSLPDGRIDLIFYRSQNEPIQIVLLGIETHANHTVLASDTLLFAISFKLLGADSLFPHVLAHLQDTAQVMPEGFWDFHPDDLQDFHFFCQKYTAKLTSLLPKELDTRKQRLFDAVYASHGSLTVQELSEKATWSPRQINRYFHQHFSLSLKAYCNILRFRASFQHLSEGKLFPEQNFADQNHFIKTTKRYTGVTPKILSENKDEQFFYLTTLRKPQS